MVEDKEEAKQREISPEDQYAKLEDQYRERLPQNWGDLNMGVRLDWFAHRILLDLREAAGREATRDWGFLSDYQLERRRRREVHSKLDGGWEDLPPRGGVFRRVHVDKNNLLTGRTLKNPESEDGSKNP